jgi:hypothetical protein
MKFSLVIAIVENALENEAIDIAKASGAGGVTLMKGVGIGLDEKKTFFGLTYERPESVLLFLLEKKISLKVMKALKNQFELESSGKGIVMTIPVEHLAGIPMKQVELFEQHLKAGEEI